MKWQQGTLSTAKFNLSTKKHRGSLASASFVIFFTAIYHCHTLILDGGEDFIGNWFENSLHCFGTSYACYRSLHCLHRWSSVSQRTSHTVSNISLSLTTWNLNAWLRGIFIFFYSVFFAELTVFFFIKKIIE